MIPTHSRCVGSHNQCSWAHAEQVSTYREERQRQEFERDESCLGYQTEIEQWNENNDMITFKKWLVMGSRR